MLGIDTGLEVHIYSVKIAKVSDLSGQRSLVDCSQTYPLSSPNLVNEATNSSRPGGSSSSGVDIAANEDLKANAAYLVRLDS